MLAFKEGLNAIKTKRMTQDRILQNCDLLVK